MPNYTIKYYFDGNGTVKVNARSQAEAKEKFLSGEFENEEEWGENYCVETIEKS